MTKEIEIPEGYEAKIEDNKVIFVQKESEDERIRTRLSEYFRGFLEGNEHCYEDGGYVRWEGLDVKSILAWLEKQKESLRDFIDNFPYSDEQKEQKPVEQLGGTFTSYDMAKTFTEGQNYVIAHPEKFGLCKPVEWSDDIIRKAVKEIGLTQHQIDWFKDNVFSSKVEWSEEDEGELQNAIDALEFLGKKGVYKSESGYDAALQAASWLKNLSLDLKKRNEDVTKLCSNEWSEEDEEIFNNIIEKAKGGHWIEVNEITWLIAWFKSLRLQPKQE